MKTSNPLQRSNIQKRKQMSQPPTALHAEVDFGKPYNTDTLPLSIMMSLTNDQEGYLLREQEILF